MLVGHILIQILPDLWWTARSRALKHLCQPPFPKSLGTSSTQLIILCTMPKRKMTDDDILVDLARRESELALQRDKAMVKRAMENYPHCCELLVRTLRSHGFDLSLETQKSSAGSSNHLPMSRQAAAQAARLEKIKANTHATALREMEEDDNKDWVPTKYWTLDSLSVTLLVSHVLSPLEPQAFSPANLRAMKKHGQAAASRVLLVQMCEFTTGADGGFELVGPLRYWPYLQQVLSARSVQRGRRAQALILPPSWDATDGIFDLDCSGQCVILRNRYTSSCCTIPAQDLAPFQALDDFFIKDNFSETKAVLKSHLNPAHPGLVCSRFLPNFIVNESIVIPSPPRIALSRTKTMKTIQDIEKFTHVTPTKPKAVQAGPVPLQAPASAAADADEVTPEKQLQGSLGWRCPGMGASAGKGQPAEDDEAEESAGDEGQPPAAAAAGKVVMDDTNALPPPPAEA